MVKTTAGMCVNTMVLSMPMRLASFADTHSDAPFITIEPASMTLTWPRSRSNWVLNHSATSEKNTNLVAKLSTEKMAARLKIVRLDGSLNGFWTRPRVDRLSIAGERPTYTAADSSMSTV